MRLYRYAANKGGDLQELFFRLSDDDTQAILLAKKLRPQGQPSQDTGYLAFAGNGRSIVAGLVSLQWHKADDVPLVLHNHPDIPSSVTKERWQVYDASPDFLDTLAGKTPKPAKPAKSSGINLGTVVISAMVTACIIVIIADWF